MKFIFYLHKCYFRLLLLGLIFFEHTIVCQPRTHINYDSTHKKEFFRTYYLLKINSSKNLFYKMEMLILLLHLPKLEIIDRFSPFSLTSPIGLLMARLETEGREGTRPGPWRTSGSFSLFSNLNDHQWLLKRLPIHPYYLKMNLIDRFSLEE